MAESIYTPLNIDNIGLFSPSDLINSASVPTAQPISTNVKSGTTVNDALNTILSLFDRGLEVYQRVAQNVSAAKQTTQSLNTPPVSAIPQQKFVGLTTNQLLLIGGGALALLVLPRLIRR